MTQKQFTAAQKKEILYLSKLILQPPRKKRLSYVSNN